MEKQIQNCPHHHIVCVTKQPKDDKGNMEAPETFVECEDCGKVLPIYRITSEVRIVPLTEFE